MKVIALISGGKDSCNNALLCQSQGHQIVALGNLYPAEGQADDLDSYMFQTVGHQVLAAYAQCAGLPLFRRRLSGGSVNQGLAYEHTEGDEVEDLLLLLQYAQQQIPEIEAVSSGAIASDYQRLRVENVCARLNLVSLAYMWRQPQAQLLMDMVGAGIHAVIIKVAAMGLVPDKHLGKSIAQLQPHLEQLCRQYGCNICGEGGEYETLVLDCPLFRHARIVVDEWRLSAESAGSFASVGLLTPIRFHLEDKQPLHISQSEASADGVGGAVHAALNAIRAGLQSAGLSLTDALFVQLYICDMGLFAAANAAYCSHFGTFRPPARACIQVNLPPSSPVAIDIVFPNQGSGQERRVLHVQSTSHWAPSCIGPYSQAAQSSEGIIWLAGQIGLDPPTMQLVEGGPEAQVRRCLQSCAAVAVAMRCNLPQGGGKGDG
ncbi:hypothetical protein WJX73_005916 [Symbiochloris irregularis]|uniref:Diphthine--ammonia ligase n=1 Tax=Symbiochloris irregularis TaxID=706552 RepID=A0AAW1PUF2_9CHLO